MKPIYMDYQATTPVDPRVVDMMLPYLTEHFGNASSRTHEYGWTARRAVDRARQQMADLIGARPKEIIFTSGATESNNLALKGAMAANRSRGDHLITVVTEHKAVLDSCTTLEREGYRVTRLPVGQDGRVDVQDVERAITDKTVLISVMIANNEIGVVQPIAEIGTLARSRQVLFHSDAAQAAGKIPFPVNDLHVDLASFSGHKFYAPKGVGVLYVRRRDPKVALIPMQDGGGHEGGFRSGTLNVPGIVGLGKAAEICAAEGENEARRILSLRDRLLEGLTARVSDLRVNGSMTHRLPHNLHVSFAGVEGHELLLALTDVAVSSGAACTSANPEPPYVLKALGIDDDLARASIRFGLGRFNTVEEVDYVVDRVADVVEGLRRSSVQRSVGSAIAL